MTYYSLNRSAKNASFKEAVIRGLAPDRGLYFPMSIVPLEKHFINDLQTYSNNEIGFRCIRSFVGDEIPEQVLYQIVEDTLSFDFPVKHLNESLSVLELFHGPTLAFKDVGARFMARCLGYFNRDSSDEITVLVATSGDTGGAVASGFLGVEGVRVVILYPAGKVSEIQERQLTTLGQNITALKVDGVFDDCQDMVKQAFLDKDLTSKMALTSANSINVARWLPQMFYYFFAYRDLKVLDKEISFSVPSGNFGNICAGMLAKSLGLPVRHFIVSNNVNDVVTRYMASKHFNPTNTIPTISNAMDVGNPSNFIRIKELYKNDFDRLKSHLMAFSFSDAETKTAMLELFDLFNYVADPHGAVGYLGAKSFLRENAEDHCIFLETAHPCKFLDVVESTLKLSLKVPENVKALFSRSKRYTDISTYEELKSYLIDREFSSK